MTAIAAAAFSPPAAAQTIPAPLLERLAHTQAGPELTVIVPTRNERDNIVIGTRGEHLDISNPTGRFG